MSELITTVLREVEGAAATGETVETGGTGILGWLSTGWKRLLAILGATNDAAAGDATGTINAHLRQIAKSLAAGIGVTFATVLPTADADITQLITVTTAGSPVQGPDKSNAGGWLIKAHPTNTSWTSYMFHGQTAVLKGVPLNPGDSLYVGVANLNSLDFDAATSLNKITAEKAPL